MEDIKIRALGDPNIILRVPPPAPVFVFVLIKWHMAPSQEEHKQQQQFCPELAERSEQHRSLGELDFGPFAEDWEPMESRRHWLLRALQKRFRPDGHKQRQAVAIALDRRASDMAIPVGRDMLKPAGISDVAPLGVRRAQLITDIKCPQNEEGQLRRRFQALWRTPPRHE